MSENRIRQLKPRPQPELAADLRELADRAERGEIQTAIFIGLTPHGGADHYDYGVNDDLVIHAGFVALYLADLHRRTLDDS